MQTCRHTQMSAFTIFAPRYHDKKVLLKAQRVAQHNKISFTKAPSLGNLPYYVSGPTVKKHKQESNGTIMCYAVPTAELELLEYKKGCEHEY